MEKIGDMEIMQVAKATNQSSKGTGSTGQTFRNSETEWVFLAATVFVATLCEEGLDFAPRGKEEEDRRIKAFAEAFIAQNETVLGYDADAPRFRKALTLCKGKFRKFPSARDIIDLLPMRPQRDQLEHKVDPATRRSLLSKHMGGINAMFDDAKGCDEVYNEEPTL